MTSPRSVAFINIPAFLIELKRLNDHTLKKRPVAIIHPGMRFARLHMLSLEAYRMGLRKGMPVPSARKICKRLILLPRDIRAEQQGFRDLTRVICRYTPVWEPLKPGHLFADLTGTEALWGSPSDTAKRLQQAVRETFSISCRIGIASNKMIARIAAKSTSCGQIQTIPEGREASFLETFPVPVLPCARASRIQELLQILNLSTILQVQQLTLPELSMTFRKTAWTLHRQAHGLDPSPVCLPRSIPVIRAGICFDGYDNDDGNLLRCLRGLLDQCLFRLRRGKRQTRSLTLRVTYADGQNSLRKKTLPYPVSFRHALLPVMNNLFYQTVQRRVQVKSMQLSLTHLTACGQEQLELWQDTHPTAKTHQKHEALEKAMDTLHEAKGWQALRIGL